MHSVLRDDFDVILKPELLARGFERVTLEGCISPEELWRRGRMWFGSSFDWRDQYFDAHLGHLFWFRDVMQRVVVVGDYVSYTGIDPTALRNRIGLPTSLREKLEVIRDSFGEAMQTYDDRGAMIIERQLTGADGIVRLEQYYAALGGEVEDEELKPYLV